MKEAGLWASGRTLLDYGCTKQESKQGQTQVFSSSASHAHAQRLVQPGSFRPLTNPNVFILVMCDSPGTRVQADPRELLGLFVANSLCPKPSAPPSFPEDEANLEKLPHGGMLGATCVLYH